MRVCSLLLSSAPHHQKAGPHWGNFWTWITLGVCRLLLLLRFRCAQGMHCSLQQQQCRPGLEPHAGCLLALQRKNVRSAHDTWERWSPGHGAFHSTDEVKQARLDEVKHAKLTSGLRGPLQEDRSMQSASSALNLDQAQAQA